MANNALFGGNKHKQLAANAVNEAGGRAYKLNPKAALAQYVATGTFNHTFYANAQTQLDTMLDLIAGVDPEFIARCALYGRGKAHMKDTPALLVAALSVLSPGLMAEVFDRVIDNGRMLRNFVQIMRSGVVGRKSLGTLPKRLVADWLNNRPADKLFRDSVGNSPSIADVIKMVHPKPKDDERRALFAYLVGRPHEVEALPALVREFESFKRRLGSGKVPAKFLPDVPMTMLGGLELQPHHWTQIARNAPWNTTRMNLNTYMRHGVFAHHNVVNELAEKLADPDNVRRARAFPYGLLSAYVNVDKKLPATLRNAFHKAMEVSVRNVPVLRRGDGEKAFVAVLPDVSGSMHSPATGYRAGATTAVRCVDAAALVAATVMRRNPRSMVVPFHDKALPTAKIDPKKSVLENAKLLAGLPSGGTNCSAPLRWLNEHGIAPDVVIFVSDNQSWLDSGNRWNDSTATVKQWKLLKERNPDAKLVCIDIQPYGSTQAQTAPDVLNIGGFNDAIWPVVEAFVAGKSRGDHWVEVIDAVSI